MDIISRQQWGARYDNGFGPAPLPAARVWLHHSVTSAGGVTSSSAIDTLAVRQLEQIGEARFGRGISYTFAVCPSGRVFEGHSVDRQGSHTGKDNTHSRGIVLVGNYDVAAPSRQALDAVAQLLDHGARSGWWTAPALTGGHRDAPGHQGTACPGRYAYAAIPSINLAARMLRAAPTTTPEDHELDAEQVRMLREIHEQTTTPHDYRVHHDAPDDIQYGQVLATRRELHDLVGGLSAQLSTLQASIGQLLGRGGPASG
jgi:hypothetical protein